MLTRIKKIIATDLVKVTSLNAAATLVRMLTGFISVKVVAVLIGPAGVALLGQLTNFTTILLNISTGGIGPGMTRYVAQYSESPKRYAIFLSTGLRIILTLSIISGLVLLVAGRFFSLQILKDASYAFVFRILGGTLILYALNTYLVAIINGFREFRKYALANMAGSVTGLLFSVVLAYNFGLTGALIGAVTYQSVVFLVTLSMVTRSSWFSKRAFRLPFSRQAGTRLGHYAIMTLVSAITVPASQLLVRSYINHSTGSMDAAGLWEGMNRISAMYLMVITTSLSVYYLPKLARLKTRAEVKTEIFQIYKLVLPFLLILSAGIYLFRGLIIEWLFDTSFADMRSLFLFQLIGDFFKIASWILAYQLIARAMTRTFIFTEIFFNGSFVLLSMLFVPMYGPLGATIGYAVNFFLYLITMVLIFRKTLFAHAS